MPNPTPKRTFLTRLSSLIIIQTAFVVAALWLVFSQPTDELTTQSLLTELSVQVRSLADTLAVVLPEPPDEHSGRLLAAITRVHPDDCYLAAASVFAPDSSARFSEKFHFVAPDTDAEDRVRVDDGLTQFSTEDLQHLLVLPPDYQIATIASPRHSIFVQRLTLRDAKPAVLVVVARHNLFISRSSSLAMVLAVIFAASAIITSLLVYLIRRQFQAPFRRLVRGMQETARGELFVIPEINEDHELDSLAASFNTLSRQLLSQQRDLLESNQRLAQSNQTLLESQLFLRALLDSTPLCVIATSADGRIILFNRQAGADFQCTPEYADGHVITEFITARQRTERPPIGVDFAVGVEAFEARCRRRTREFFPAYVISSKAHDSSGRTVANIYIIRDITESRSFQEMMVRLDRNYTRGEMAGDIAHEINNYLAILSGNIELMAMLLDTGDRAKIDKKLGIMNDTTDKIARFTDGLMDVPQGETAFEKADLNQLVENVLAFLKPQNKFDKITIETELSTELPLVEMDSAKIQQLLVNFIYNAADAVQESNRDRQITICTRVLLDSEQPEARIEVRDSGPGVEPSKQPLLFTKRFTTKRRGHGIGLITCRRIAETHGGEAGYDDATETVFYCRFPITHPTTRSTTSSVASLSAETVCPVCRD